MQLLIKDIIIKVQKNMYEPIQTMYLFYEGSSWVPFLSVFGIYMHDKTFLEIEVGEC